RKPERVPRAVWQPVFDSRYTPLPSLRGVSNEFRSPWLGDGPGWEIDGKLVYSFRGSGRAALRWDSSNRGIEDFCPYNEGPYPQSVIFPVSDVRVSFAIKPAAPGQSAAVDLRARRHEFRAEVSGKTVTLRMREAAPGQDSDQPW